MRQLLLGFLFTGLAVAGLLVLLRLVRRVFPAAEVQLEEWRSTRIPSLGIQRLELLSADRLTDFLVSLVRALRLITVVALWLTFVPLVFSFFPWTEPFSERLFDYLLTPLRQVGNAFVRYIPNLFFVAIIVLVTRYALRFIRLFFRSVERGTLTFDGFHREWADPTYKIVRFLVLAFAFVVIFPYLPGSDSQAFKGVSVFLGVLVSLGSAGAIGNVVAGVVITYMRPFKVGDRVKIADTTGDVIEKTLLVTRVRTAKNVDTTIPNAMVLASHIINYSSIAKDHGVILHTTVTIGYDAHWKRVHQLLLAAAERTEHTLKDPKPFVLQTSLDDFYVSYELNVYTDEPNRMSRTYSDLHQHIQDTFAEASVEIMSPHYRAERDGTAPAMPKRP
ncbi:MAG: mechanosensitive ion channel family protein [Gemmatimonadales bacterium]